MEKKKNLGEGTTIARELVWNIQYRENSRIEVDLSQVR